MILRHLAQGLRRRDWFTVFMEIVIVTLGVSIGMAAVSQIDRSEP